MIITWLKYELTTLFAKCASDDAKMVISIVAGVAGCISLVFMVGGRIMNEEETIIIGQRLSVLPTIYFTIFVLLLLRKRYKVFISNIVKRL